MFDWTQENMDFVDRLSSNCDSWKPSGNSLIAQHPRQYRNKELSE